jgi:hypothetical protein
MKINVVYGPETDKNIQKCYELLISKYKKEQLKEEGKNPHSQ